MAEPTDPPTRDETAIALLAEEARLRVVEREQGRVRVAIRVEDRHERIAAELTDESVEIERQPADEVVDTPPASIEQDGVLVIPVVEEMLVVQRRFRITERIVVRRVRTARPVDVPITVRREVADIERRPPAASSEPNT